MPMLEWATVLDCLYDDPQDQRCRAWAEQALADGRGTPGQKRSYELLISGQDIVELLAQTPTLVAALIANASPEQMSEQSAPGEWSATHVVHHLADNEAVNAVRIRSILTEDEPEIFGYDSDPWTRFFDIEPVTEALDRFRICRRNTVALARSLSPSDLDRRGNLSYRGTESLRVLLAVLAGHDQDHLDQIRSALKAT